VQASRYKIQELIDTQGAVSTYQALDTLSNEPVLYYQYLAEPMDNAVQILSDNIPDILNMHYISGMTHVVTVLPTEKQPVTERLESSQLEQFLLDTSQALEDASDAGVVHGDIRPERLLFDGSKYLIEGYGIRWEYLESRYSAPEKKQSVAGDVYSWAKTAGAFVPKNSPKLLVELLQNCLQEDPKDRPLPEDVVDEIRSFFLEASQSSRHPRLVKLKQTIADAQPDLLDSLFGKGQSHVLTSTQERFTESSDTDALNTEAFNTEALNSQNNVEPTEQLSEKSAEDVKEDTEETIIEASVAVDGSENLKLSTANLASSNLQDISELRDSRADMSANEADSMSELNSSARVTDANSTNQSISNEPAFMASPTDSVSKTSHDSQQPANGKTELDTIDESLAAIVRNTL